ncbi:MAG TPA: undecaprenyldiphospho-muramoylpentapeptide beta-N-acetylglucosaminyltransferase [Microvirga sp.]|jgi:UDP-N-acetylglucosamine--N-acetylmuramyl-(pentapeptide) pyrophosphoryl-undecaprenol N-acetylglucosamine transferase|nr:undecaprenyldiphospho-muramoylpentapeptide beta-N-acetylglucosaminyltransferase [Microvirga sp.]
MSDLVLIAAGGTGGHLFPAESLAVALKARGARVALATDHRVGAIAGSFPAEEVIEVPSATPSGRSVPQMARAALLLSAGVAKAVPALRRLKPTAVVGFGGYPTVPPLAAAALLRLPVVIHEQNGVMGRANRLLARWATLIATGFPEVRGIPANAPGRRIHTGNPIRPAVLEAARRPMPEVQPGGVVNLLVFGGSQGARVMSDVVPAGLERLSPEHRSRLAVVQQAREEDMARVRDLYTRLGITAELQPFFKDLPRRMAEAHLVIGRSGASTVAELAVIGRPSILVPLPGALDQDQAANARSLEAIGAATMILQDAFTPERLADELKTRFEDSSRLTKGASAAKSAGITDAAERLADAVLALGGAPQPKG